MPPTIADVARRSGVSIKQVSRVINNQARVAPATRARVLRAIDELGYVPNISAQRLARGYSSLLGLCIYSATPDYIMEVLRGMMDVADRFQYGVGVYRFDPADAGKVQQMLAWAAQRHVDALVLTPPIDNAEHLVKGLRDLDFPFIQLTPHDRGNGCAWVAPTDEMGSYAATHHLLALGHTRLAFIQGPTDQVAGWDRLRGFQAALAQAGLAADPALVRQGDWSFQSGLALTRDLLREPARPTAIICSGDQIAAGAIHAIWESGLHCPADISVTGFNDIELAQQIWPPLTTVRQPVYEIATTATTLLIEKLIPGDREPVGVEIATALVERSSTGPPPNLSSG